MVAINHFAVYVTDLERARDFYQTYFDGTPGHKYHNPRTGLQTYFLTFEGGARLELMTRPELGDHRRPSDAGWNHLAFSVGSATAVDQLTARLAGDGYTVTSGPRTTGDGYYESVALDPEGNQVEITV
jgi:lactoylglutathione lyase